MRQARSAELSRARFRVGHHLTCIQCRTKSQAPPAEASREAAVFHALSGVCFAGTHRKTQRRSQCPVHRRKVRKVSLQALRSEGCPPPRPPQNTAAVRISNFPLPLRQSEAVFQHDSIRSRALLRPHRKKRCRRQVHNSCDIPRSTRAAFQTDAFCMPPAAISLLFFWFPQPRFCSAHAPLRRVHRRFRFALPQSADFHYQNDSLINTEPSVIFVFFQ